VSSSAFDQSGHEQEQSYRSEAEQPTAANQAEQERRLLDEVLRQTQAAFDSHETDDLAEMGPFLDVAKRHADSELTLEPVVLELVKAALAETIGALPGKDDQPDRIPLKIATTLFEDPACHDRLVVFWSRLLATQK